MVGMELDEALSLDASGGMEPERALELSPLTRDFLRMARTVSEGDIVDAIHQSEDILERSRSMEERDPEIEARVRLERALLGRVKDGKVGQELRWVADRLASIRPGSPGHALSLLNLAAWHASIGETMMALAVHSEITSAADHPSDLVALSRLEVGRLHQNLGDEESSLRHLWSSATRFNEVGMVGEEAIALLEWLDLALDVITEEAQPMEEIISMSLPRTNLSPSVAASHPDDIRIAALRLCEIILKDPAGEKRPDIGLLVDAAHCLSDPTISSILADNVNRVEDPQVLEWIHELDPNGSESDQS